MKPNELMIGDWVFIDHCSNRLEPCYGQVMGIDKTGEDIYTTEGMVDVSLVKPVPLTQEILERNGFSAQNDGHMGYIYYHLDHVPGDCTLGMSWYLKDSEGEISLNAAPYRIIIKYVHELQHVLRLCGIEREIK